MKPRRISPGIGGPNHRMIGLRPILGSKCFQPAGLNVGPSGYDLMILDGRARSDTDAAAFISAASISDSTQQTAIYFLVGALKDTGLWTKMTACYPFVGGNATAHSKDLKAAYNITWSGTVTHNSNGVTGNGSTGYGDTGLNANSVLSLNSTHLSLYSRTDSATVSRDMGVRGASGIPGLTVYLKFTDNLAYWSVNASSEDSAAVTDSLGLNCFSRTSSALSAFFKNGRKIAKKTTASSSIYNGNVFICAVNQSGSPAGYSARNFAFSSIGSGLSDSDAQNLSMIVQSYQTILGRAV